jgi:hypothetical protein
MQKSTCLRAAGASSVLLLTAVEENPRSGAKDEWLRASALERGLFIALLSYRFLHSLHPRAGGLVRENLPEGGGCEPARVVVYSHPEGGIIGVNHNESSD